MEDPETGPKTGTAGTSAVDQLPDGVVIADAQGVVTVVNDQARKLLGAKAREGRHLSEVPEARAEQAGRRRERAIAADEVGSISASAEALRLTAAAPQRNNNAGADYDG